MAAALWSLLVGFLLAEGAARIWLAHYASDDLFRSYASLAMLRDRMEGREHSLSLYLPHRYLGYVPAPHYRHGRNHHDERGFRGRAVQVPKPPGQFRIVCLGGSTTYGSFVEAPEEAYPARLEAALRRLGARRVRVVNGGASGWTSLQSLINLETRVLDLEPDLVIDYDGVNDVSARMVWPPSAYRGDESGWVLHSGGLDAAPPWYEPLSVVRIPLVATGLVRSRLDLAETLGHLASTQHYFRFANQRIDGSYPSEIFAEVSAAAMLAANPPTYFRRNLESLVAVARVHGVVPVLATFAWSEKVTADRVLTSPEVTAALAEQNAVVREIGRAQKVPVYDFAAEMPDDPALYVDAVHTNVDGSRVQGRLFAEFLVREGLVPLATTGVQPLGPPGT